MPHDKFGPGTPYWELGDEIKERISSMIASRIYEKEELIANLRDFVDQNIIHAEFWDTYSSLSGVSGPPDASSNFAKHERMISTVPGYGFREVKYTPSLIGKRARLTIGPTGARLNLHIPEAFLAQISVYPPRQSRDGVALGGQKVCMIGLHTREAWAEFEGYTKETWVRIKRSELKKGTRGHGHCKPVYSKHYSTPAYGCIQWTPHRKFKISLNKSGAWENLEVKVIEVNGDRYSHELFVRIPSEIMWAWYVPANIE